MLPFKPSISLLISTVHTRKENFPHSGQHYLETGEVLTDETIEELRGFDTILLGAVGCPGVKPGIIEHGILLKLRFQLDQYINLRPVKLYPGVDTPLKGKTTEDINYLVVRENTGGLYTGAGGVTMKGTEHETAIQTMMYTYEQVERCLRYAFETAQGRERKKLALIGKSNVLMNVFDLWLRVMDDLKKEFPEVDATYYHVDACCMFMVKTPEMFDVLVTTNMFGDSSLTSVLKLKVAWVWLLLVTSTQLKLLHLCSSQFTVLLQISLVKTKRIHSLL